MGTRIVAAVLGCALLTIAKAAPHRLRIYPNPSIAILGITAGPDGLLWLATEDGLYRFDGFHYHKIASYPFISARLVAFTSDGSLWCGGIEGLARFHRNRFEVVLNQEVVALAASANQLFVRLASDFVRIGLDGSVRRLNMKRTSLPRRDLLIDSSGRLWFVCRDATTSACWIDPNAPDALNTIELPAGYEFHQVTPGPNGGVWGADNERAILIENGRVASMLRRQSSRESTRASPLLRGRNGQLWFIGEDIYGLNPRVRFHDRADHDRFSPTAAFEDKRGHLWIAALGQGLVEWIPELDWQRWPSEEFASEATVQVVRDRQGSLVLATRKNLYRYEAGADEWFPLANEQRRYESLLPLEDGGFLASIRDFGLARLSPHGRIVERLSNPVPGRMDYRELIRDGKGRFWVGTKQALFRMERQDGSLHLRKESLPDVTDGESQAPIDLQLDREGHLWAGYVNGIGWLDEQQRWHKLETDQTVNRVRSFTLAGDDIWVAHRYSGAFSRLHRNGEKWNVTHFSANGGYGPVDTDFLKRDSRGWIWRGCTDGVYISDGRHFGPNDWIHIHPGNGLATSINNQYGFFEDTDHSIWIAGDEGVTHFRPDASWFDAPHASAAPLITRLEADGREFVFPEPLPSALPSGTKVLRIDAGSLQSSAFRDRPLRYRLLPASKEWQLSRDGRLEFRNLPLNAYALEAGYAGNGPSTIATFRFRIGPAPWSLPWRWLAAFVIAAAALRLIAPYVPWLEWLSFQVEKNVFVLRRRYGRGHFRSTWDGGPGPQDRSGETFADRYHLSRIVCRGGFSVVYEARDLLNGNCRLAVKVLNRIPTEESWVRDRFAHEVAALRSVRHPGVVPVLDSWISPTGEPCLAMPFLEGQTLRAALKQMPFEAPRVARIVRQLGEALSGIHAHGIIHRDLKPENLILVSPGTDLEQPVIIDFGTAGLRSGENELAATTLMAGSFHYMAPERLTGHYSAATDVFSFGVIVLEMLTGKRLMDLNAMFSDSSFKSELEKTLRAALDEDSARTVAERLCLAYNPEPRRRPAAVETWAESVARAIDQA